MIEDDSVATGLELSLQELIYAGLDALRASRGGIELVAYLHSSGDNGPQLFLAAPTLGSMRANEAFDLFAALRDALGRPGDDVDEATAEFGGFHALTVATSGTMSRGLHAVGRRGAPLTTEDREVLVPLARMLGKVNHRLEEATQRLARG